jgi:branched-chain amino acid transport system permease protein
MAVNVLSKNCSIELNQGIVAYVRHILLHVISGSYLVYTQPRSNLAFLVFISSLLSLYFFRADNRFVLN